MKQFEVCQGCEKIHEIEDLLVSQDGDVVVCVDCSDAWTDQNEGRMEDYDGD